MLRPRTNADAAGSVHTNVNRTSVVLDDTPTQKLREAEPVAAIASAEVPRV